MKTFISQVNGGIAAISSKNEKTAAKALNIPIHQFIWSETSDPAIVKLAKKDEMIVIGNTQQEASVKENADEQKNN